MNTGWVLPVKKYLARLAAAQHSPEVVRQGKGRAMHQHHRVLAALVSVMHLNFVEPREPRFVAGVLFFR
jgi:hypothetical protein